MCKYIQNCHAIFLTNNSPFYQNVTRYYSYSVSWNLPLKASARRRKHEPHQRRIQKTYDCLDNRPPTRTAQLYCSTPRCILSYHTLAAVGSGLNWTATFQNIN
jgi:hypothetical protein